MDTGFSWSSIPTELLRAELSKRDDATTNADANGAAETQRPECGSGKKGEYDTALHVFALFLIFFVSTSACGFPLLSRRVAKSSKRQRTIIFICQHFGTGVLMATAFVHLLPTAFTSLTDPCLPWFFSVGYKPLAGLVAMISALVVVAIESYLSTRGAGHSHSHHAWEDDDADDEAAHHHTHNERSSTGRRFHHNEEDYRLDDLEASQGLVRGASPLPASTPRMPPPRGSRSLLSNDDDHGKESEDSDGEHDRESVDLNLALAGSNSTNDAAAQPLTPSSSSANTIPKSEPAIRVRDTYDHTHAHIAPEEQKRMVLQCRLLEAGILFHSVFIGMALSVATGPPFAVFLVAIAFHQCFEGLALGTRIAALQFSKRSPEPWLMVLAFGATTPIGQAIGLLVHSFYDPLSQTGLLMVGFMNAVSSGLLLFAGLVQLLAEDFLSEKSYKTLYGTKRLQAYMAVVGGAGLMSAVGAFA